MCDTIRIRKEIDATIITEYAGPTNRVSMMEALTTLTMMSKLYDAGEELKNQGVLNLEESKGKTEIAKFIYNRQYLLPARGEFIPAETDGSHLKPARFIEYIQRAMRFFCEHWDTASPAIRKNLIVTLLTHNTLTYPRLVAYIQKWTPPDRSDLGLMIESWLYSDMTDVFTHAQFTVSNQISVAEQIRRYYLQKREVKETYCIFWGNMIEMVNRTFSLGYDKGRLYEKIKASRTVLHTALTGYISVQEIDVFIDNCFDDVYNWMIIGGDSEEP